jgi:hypothetical protein
MIYWGIVKNEKGIGMFTLENGGNVRVFVNGHRAVKIKEKTSDVITEVENIVKRNTNLVEELDFILNLMYNDYISGHMNDYMVFNTFSSLKAIFQFYIKYNYLEGSLEDLHKYLIDAINIRKTTNDEFVYEVLDNVIINSLKQIIIVEGGVTNEYL